jgi:dihydroxyacetone kinase-like predicted kinase
VIPAAQQVQELTRKRVRVVPSRSVPQGIAALLALDFSADIEQNAASMAVALSQVQTIEVTKAVRAGQYEGGRIAEGDVLGLLNDRVVEVGRSFDQVVERVMTRIKPESVQTITVYSGSEAGEEKNQLVDRLRARFPSAGVELQAGGQPLYPYIVAVE